MPGHPDSPESLDPDSGTSSFDRTDEAVFELDDERRLTFVTERAADLLGVDSRAVVGASVAEVLPGGAEAGFVEALDAAMSTREPVWTEFYLEPRERWVETRVYPSTSGLTVSLREGDERPERGRTLDFRSALLEAQAETTIDGQLVVDDDRNILYYNDRFAELWGIPERVLSERSDERALEYVLEKLADPDEFLRKIEYLYDNPTEESRDEIPLADGRWFDRYSAPVVGENGTHYGRLWLFRDITDRKEREQFLADAKARLEAAAEAGAVGTWEWHVQEDEVVTTPSFAGLFGVDPEEIEEGAPVERFLSSIHDDDRDRVEASIEETLATCGEYQEEYRVRNADGDLRWVVARGEVECDDDGTPVTFSGAVTDITERKEYQRKLEASNERLQQFAYALSHDLQEPLRMVSSYLRLVERRYASQLDEDGREFVEYAVNGADRMREMIDGLLAYSKVESRPESFEPVDLNAVLEDVRTDLQIRIEEADAEITSDRLPTVSGDEEQLREVFLHLLENAIEYSGDEPPRVHFSAERTDDEWVVAIADEGIGIAPGDQERIFRVFERLHGPEEHEGAGLGLSLCERIVEGHGGEIRVESDPDEGTTFSLTFPRSPEQAVTESTDRPVR